MSTTVALYRLFITCCIFISVFSPGFTRKVSANRCPFFERPVHCINQCLKCEYKDKECFQPAVCTPGCQCLSGFLRNQQGVCIPASTCPGAGPIPSPCPGPNEVPVSCIDRCQKCEYINKPCFQIQVCTPGCDCALGYFRDKQNICVPAALCPSACGPNEEYSECGTDCPSTCDNRKNIACPAVCGEGCFCKKGFIRDTKSGKCIPCPPNVCGLNEVYSACVNICNTCQNRNVTCNFLVCNEGCDCRPGYTRNDQGICIPENLCSLGQCSSHHFKCRTGKCIPIAWQCDGENDCGDGSDELNCGTCGPNEEYSDCGSACPRTCDGPKDVACIQVCVEGCFCKKGFIRETENGKCIPEIQCPPTSQVCGPNEVYSDCVNPCNDCVTKGNCQFLVCNKGCDCRPDFRRHLGICISDNQCPAG